MPDDPVKTMLQPFAANGAKLGVTHIGSKKECYQMLELASKKNLKPIIQLMDMKNAKEAVETLYGKDKSKVRYRCVRFTCLLWPLCMNGADFIHRHYTDKCSSRT